MLTLHHQFQYQYQHLSPEIVCDSIQSQLERLDIILSEETYAHIWDDVEKRNEALGVRPMTEEEKYAHRRQINLQNY